MANAYYVYLNTLVFAIVAGVVSMILLLALMYVPAVTEYAPLIMTVQVGLIGIVVVAVVRIMASRRAQEKATRIDTQNTLAVGFCPDYMVAAPDTSVTGGGGTMCYNAYDGAAGKRPVWTNKGAPATDTIRLAQLDKKPISAVCAAINDVSTPPVGGLLTSPTSGLVPWTDLQSRCGTFSYT